MLEFYFWEHWHMLAVFVFFNISFPLSLRWQCYSSLLVLAMIIGPQSFYCPYVLFRIPVIFQGDLAKIAACHLNERDHVYITGQLSGDAPPVKFENVHANVQVEAKLVCLHVIDYLHAKIMLCMVERLKWLHLPTYYCFEISSLWSLLLIS